MRSAMALVPSGRSGRAAASPLLMLVLLVSACGSVGAQPTATPGISGSSTVVTVTLREFKAELSSTAFPAGSITFNVKNAGTVQHEFVIMRTTLQATALPTTSAKTEVDENSSWLERMGEADHIDPGATKSFTVTMPAGAYVGLCNVPGHYGAGMRVAITVQ